MGRIADVNEEEGPITGFKFVDNDGDVATATISLDGRLINLEYNAYDIHSVALTPKEARNLASIINRAVDLIPETGED